MKLNKYITNCQLKKAILVKLLLYENLIINVGTCFSTQAQNV